MTVTVYASVSGGGGDILDKFTDLASISLPASVVSGLSGISDSPDDMADATNTPISDTLDATLYQNFYRPGSVVSTKSSGTTTIAAPSVPVGVVAGDKMVFIYATRQGALTTPTSPAGWDLEVSATSSVSERCIFMWTRTYVAADAAPALSGLTTDQKAVACFAITSALRPDVVGSGSGASPPILPSITTLTAKSCLVEAVYANLDGNTTQTAATHGERIVYQVQSSQFTLTVYWYLQGATGNTNPNLLTPWGATRYGGIVAAFPPV